MKPGPEKATLYERAMRTENVALAAPRTLDEKTLNKKRKAGIRRVFVRVVSPCRNPTG